MQKLFFSLLFISGSNFLFSQTLLDCETCNSTILKEDQLSGKSVEELALLRNEIFARRGFIFSAERLSRYFETKIWYKPSNSNENITFSHIESKNITLLKNVENKEKTKRENAIHDLKELKKALNENNKPILSKYLKKIEKNEFYLNQLDELKTTLNYINLDKINWNKDSGLYSIKLDDGYAVYNYVIRFTNNEIQIINGMNEHSQIFGDFDDGYSDYQSEFEYQSWYIFKITPNGILFDDFQGAG